MGFHEYRSIKFTPATQAVIDHAVKIAGDYADSGDSLTLRQLYYRFVAGGLIANKDTEYKRLGSIINDARYAGEFDWEWITDRTREVRGGDGDEASPRDSMADLRFFPPIWQGQKERVEVWVEKDALVDVVGRAANPLRTPFFSCRGYTSSSEIWAAAQRIEGYLDEDEDIEVTILHLGDHDPSGIDMTRDVTARIKEFLWGDEYDEDRLTVHRIALNMDQVNQYDPPPNPAKLTDSRSRGYVARYGRESWELDALEPAVLRELISDNIQRHIPDSAQWNARIEVASKGNATLAAFRNNYAQIEQYLTTEGLL